MNEFQLSCLLTGDLINLQKAVTNELNKRKKRTKLQKRLSFADSLNPIHVDPNSEIELFNSSSILRLPGWAIRTPHSNAAYLPALIRQDWSHLYNGGDKTTKYYVYAHVDPNKQIFVTGSEAGGNFGGEPFYIGKGTGDRAFDFNRNQGHGKLLNSILASGINKERIAKILIDGLTEAKAFEIEAKLIYFFGTIYAKHQKKKGMLLNLDTPKIPNFVGEMKEYDRRVRYRLKQDCIDEHNKLSNTF